MPLRTMWGWISFPLGFPEGCRQNCNLDSINKCLLRVYSLPADRGLCEDTKEDAVGGACHGNVSRLLRGVYHGQENKQERFCWQWRQESEKTKKVSLVSTQDNVPTGWGRSDLRKSCRLPFSKLLHLFLWLNSASLGQFLFFQMKILILL